MASDSNSRDAEMGERLAVTALAAVVRAALALEHEHLLRFALLHDLGGHRSARERRRAELGLALASTDHEHARKRDSGADIAFKFFDADKVSRADAVLLSTS